MAQSSTWDPMSAAQNCEGEITGWLGTSRKDFKAATEFLNKLAAGLNDEAKANTKVGFSLPDSTFGALSLLELAIIHNRVDFFDAIAKFKQRIELYNVYDYSLEYLSVLHNFNNGNFEEILSKIEESVAKKPERKPNPLIQASAAGHIEVFKYFHKTKPGSLNELADPDPQCYADQRTVLETAALHNQIEVCRYILSLKDFKLVSHQSPLGNTLHIAARLGHAGVVQAFLDYQDYSKPLLESADPSGFTALGLAVLNGHIEVVELLLKHNASVHTVQDIEDKQTLLQVALSKPAQLREELNAIENSQPGSIVLMLVEHGASQEGLNKEQLDIVNVLIKRTKVTVYQGTLPAEQSASIPGEIWSGIIDKIDHHYLSALSTVSKLFSEIVDRPTWSNLHLVITKDWLKKHDNKVFTEFSHKLKHVVSLKIDCDRYVTEDTFVLDQMFADISKHCLNLQELDLSRYRGLVTISFMNELYRNCKKLKSLKVDTVVHEHISEEREKVERNGKEEDMLTGFDKTFNSISTSLQSLEIAISLGSHKVGSSPEIVREVLLQSPQLTKLRLINIDNQAEDFVPNLLRTVILPLFDTHTRLKVLGLAGAWGTDRLSKIEWETLYTKFGTLEEFEIFDLQSKVYFDFDSEDSDDEDHVNNKADTLNYVAKYCINLQSLSLGASCKRSNEDNFPLTTLQHLKKFYMVFLDETWVDGAKIIKNMSAACPKLEEIQLIAMKGPAKACNFERIKFGPALREFHYLPRLNSVAPFVQASNTLKTLIIGTISMNDFNVLIDNCSLLVDLSVKIGGEDAVNFGKILLKLPNLAHLNLRGVYNDSSFRTPAVGLNLKRLIFDSKQQYMSDLPLFYLSEACPNLEELTYEFGVSYDLAYLLERRLPRLRELSTERNETKILQLANRKRMVKIK